MSEPKFVLTAKYRVVTPMFLSGAEQSEAELRLPSFKGALRFWWRALAKERDVGRLRDVEDRLFGSTRGVSQLRMRLTSAEITTKSITRKFSPGTWQGYTGYGLTEKGARSYIEPGATFAVRVQLDSFRCTDAEHNRIKEALITLGLVGGLGSRSRNGWGSIALVSLNGEGFDWKAPVDADSLRSELETRLRVNEPPADWSAFSEQSMFAVGPPQDMQEEAHRWLAEKYKDTLKGLSQDKARREAFGLPRKNAGKNSGQRRAGTTFLHVHQVEGEKAIPVALCLPARFLANQKDPHGGWPTAQEFVKGVASR